MSLRLEKRQLRNDHILLGKLLKQYGNVTLFEVYDHLSVKLDNYRGVGTRKRGEIKHNDF